MSHGPQPASAGQASPAARLDRIPVWPYRYSVLVVLGLGYIFMFFDITNIAVGIPVFAKQFAVSEAAAAQTVTSSLVGYIVGALLISTMSDLFGRRRALLTSVALFSLGSILSAFSPSLSVLIVLRFFVGAGIGAEIAAVTTYLGEICPAAVRGRYTSWANVIGLCGLPLVPIIAVGVVPSFSWGWRLMLLIGAVGGLALLAGRKNLPESPRWLATHGRTEKAESVVAVAESRAQQRTGAPLPEVTLAWVETEPRKSQGLPFAILLRRPYLTRVLVLVAIWIVYYIGNYGWVGLAPTLLVDKGYSLAESIGFTIGTALGYPIGALATVWFTDRIERKTALVLIGSVWTISLVLIGVFPSPGVIIGLGFLATATIGLWDPIMYTLTGEHFPTRARNLGLACGDGIGHVGGAIAPAIVLSAFAAFGFGGAFYVMAATGLIATLLTLLTVRATGRSLETVTERLSERESGQAQQALPG